MKNKIKKFFKRIIAIVQQPEINILPGQIAFFFVLSIVPIFTIIIILGTSLSLSSDTIVSYFNNILPTGIIDSLIQVLNYNKLDINAIILLITTLILASNGAFSIINASNTIYKTKPTMWLRRRVKSVFLTFSLVFLLIFLLLIPTFGTKILSVLSSIDIISNVVDKISLIFNVIAVPISIFIIYFNIKLIYVISPDKKIKSSSVTMGALFTTFGWIISSKIYSYYVLHFSKYDLVYGSLANIIILMLWFYIIAYIFVVGMSLNAINEENANNIIKNE